MQRTLAELLAEADALFPAHDQLYDVHSFDLARVGRGLWVFTVTDDWHKWHRKNLETHFGLYGKPEYAVAAFLTYVRTHKISVKRLMEKPMSKKEIAAYRRKLARAEKILDKRKGEA